MCLQGWAETVDHLWSTCVTLQELFSWFSRAKFKLHKRVDWLRAETDDHGYGRNTHTSPDNATTHHDRTHLLLHLFLVFKPVDPDFVFKAKGFWMSNLCTWPKMSLFFFNLSAWRCRLRVSVKICAGWCSIRSPLQPLLLCLFSLHSLFSRGP